MLKADSEQDSVVMEVQTLGKQSSNGFDLRSNLQQI
jgi:hypothetical protein